MIAEDLLALSELLDEALDLDERARNVWLEDLQRTQPQIASRLEALLKRTSELKTDHLLINDGRSVAPEVLADVMEATSGEAKLQGFLLQPGAQVGPYRLIKPLGEGGMASVWLAERSDGQLKREVALKLLHAWRNSKELVERFARERDMLAGLVHPHIARLYDAGVTETGQPWIALEYVEGIDLAAYADTNRLPIRARVEAMLQVMSAVQHAHQNLIVHRDIKPSNILVNTKGEVRLLDFGIAKLLDVNENSAAESELTKNAGRALTIRYAAPEQISGDPVTTATDVYALGLVMYELLTGASPRHGGKTQIIAEQAALSTDVLRPSRAAVNEDLSHRRGNITARELKTALAGDLDTIILKALAREPARRYRTVDAFAADLHAWLEQRPIAARAPSFTYQLKMLLVRQRVPVAMGCAALIALSGAGVFAWKQRLQADAQRQRAEQVQMFMANLLSDAEPEGIEGEKALTAKSLLDAGVERAKRDFVGQQLTRGALLAELGRVYLRIGERGTGQAVMREAIEVIERDAGANEPLLHSAKAHLGADLMIGAQWNEGAAILQKVIEDCRFAVELCEQAKGIAHYSLARTPSIGVQQKRAHLEESRALLAKLETSGSVSKLKFQSLLLSASFERTQGDVALASALMKEAEKHFVSGNVKLIERGHFRTTQCNIELENGDFERAAEVAEAGIRELGQSRLAPARLYLHAARAHVANYQGLTSVALQHAKSAREVASSMGPTANLAYAMRYEARAYAMAGDFASAKRSVKEAFALLETLGVKNDTETWLDIARVDAEVKARNGEFSAAKKQLLDMVELQKSRPSIPLKDRVNTLQLVGAVLLAMGESDRAMEASREEMRLLKTSLPSTHPLRLRAELLLLRVDNALSPKPSFPSDVSAITEKLLKFIPQNSVHAETLARLASSSSNSGNEANKRSLFLVF